MLAIGHVFCLGQIHSFTARSSSCSIYDIRTLLSFALATAIGIVETLLGTDPIALTDFAALLAAWVSTKVPFAARLTFSQHDEPAWIGLRLFFEIIHADKSRFFQNNYVHLTLLRSRSAP